MILQVEGDEWMACPLAHHFMAGWTGSYRGYPLAAILGALANLGEIREIPWYVPIFHCFLEEYIVSPCGLEEDLTIPFDIGSPRSPNGFGKGLVSPMMTLSPSCGITVGQLPWGVWPTMTRDTPWETRKCKRSGGYCLGMQLSSNHLQYLSSTRWVAVLKDYDQWLFMLKPSMFVYTAWLSNKSSAQSFSKCCRILICFWSSTSMPSWYRRELGRQFINTHQYCHAWNTLAGIIPMKYPWYPIQWVWITFSNPQTPMFHGKFIYLNT